MPLPITNYPTLTLAGATSVNNGTNSYTTIGTVTLAASCELKPAGTLTTTASSTADAFSLNIRDSTNNANVFTGTTMVKSNATDTTMIWGSLVPPIALFSGNTYLLQLLAQSTVSQSLTLSAVFYPTKDVNAGLINNATTPTNLAALAITATGGVTTVIDTSTSAHDANVLTIQASTVPIYQLINIMSGSGTGSQLTPFSLANVGAGAHFGALIQPTGTANSFYDALVLPHFFNEGKRTLNLGTTSSGTQTMYIGNSTVSRAAMTVTVSGNLQSQALAV